MFARGYHSWNEIDKENTALFGFWRIPALDVIQSMFCPLGIDSVSEFASEV